jgi:GT2 family glycosyltransferase
MPDGRVGVVTVTYNSGLLLDAFLQSLKGQSFQNYALYAIDNCSQDHTRESLEHGNPPAITIANDSNVGFAAAANAGIVRALKDGCELILLLNNDTYFGPTVIEVMVRELGRHSADLIAPKIRYADASGAVWFAGGDLRLVRGFAGQHVGMGVRDSELQDVPRRCSFAPACCLLIRREVFDRIGLLDPRYFLYFEDTDFCYRAQRHNLSLWYTPEATVYHAVGSLSGGDRALTVIRYNTQGHSYFLYKHFGVVAATAWVSAYQGKIFWKYLTGRYSGIQTKTASRALWDGARLAWRPGTRAN